MKRRKDFVLGLLAMAGTVAIGAAPWIVLIVLERMS